MVVVRRLAVCALCVCVLATAGCPRVHLTFVNRTGEPLDVHLTSPARSREYLGVLSPMGSLEHGLSIGSADIPADCVWSAGPYTGRFLLEKDTAKEMRIGVGP